MGGEMRKYTCLLLFLFIAILSSQSTNNPTIDLERSFREPPAPITIHEKITYLSTDTVLDELDYTFKSFSYINYSYGFGLDYNVTNDSKIVIWDYKRYVDGKLNLSKPFIEFYPDGDKRIGQLPPYPVYPNSSISFSHEEYKISNYIITTKTDESLYPFDTYLVNKTMGGVPFVTLYSLYIEIPKTFQVEPEKSVYNSSCSVIKKIIMEQYGNNRSEETDLVTLFFASDVEREIYEFNNVDKKTIVLPPICLSPLGTSNQTKIQIELHLRRSDLIIQIFLFSIGLMILVSLFKIFRGGQILDMPLMELFGIWVFQEGIISILPSYRPFRITLFDTTLLIGGGVYAVLCIFVILFNVFRLRYMRGDLVGIQRDAGEVLAYIYNRYTANEKDFPMPDFKIIGEIKWDTGRIKRTVDYLDGKKLIEVIRTLDGFMIEKPTPGGIDTIENKDKFKSTFGFEINLGLFKFSWSKEKPKQS